MQMGLCAHTIVRRDGRSPLNCMMPRSSASTHIFVDRLTFDGILCQSRRFTED